MFTSGVQGGCVGGFKEYVLGLGGLCSYGCAVEYAWFVGSDGSSRELTRASTGEDTYKLDDKLVLRLDGGVLALTLDEDVLKGGGLEGTLNVTLKGVVGSKVALQTVSIEVEPRYVTPDMVEGALREALGMGTPEGAARSFVERLASKLLEGTDLNLSSGLDPAGLLATCQGGGLPVMLSNRETELDIQDLDKQLKRALLRVAQDYDRGEVGPETQGYALCLQDGGGGKLGGQLCYGRYIDEKVVGQLLSRRNMLSYAAGCTAGLFACEFGTKTLPGLILAGVEAGLICGLPTVLATQVGESTAEALKQTGELSYTDLTANTVGNMLRYSLPFAVAKPTLEAALERRYAGRLADLYESYLKQEGRKARARSLLLPRRTVEKLAEEKLKAFYSPEVLGKADNVEVRILLLRILERDPDSAAAIQYLCNRGKCDDALKHLSSWGAEAKKGLLTLYAHELVNEAEEQALKDLKSQLDTRARVDALEEALQQRDPREYFTFSQEVEKDVRTSAWKGVSEMIDKGEILMDLAPPTRKEFKEAVEDAMRNGYGDDFEKHIDEYAERIYKKVNIYVDREVIPKSRIKDYLRQIHTEASRLRAEKYRNILQDMVQKLRSGEMSWGEFLEKVGINNKNDFAERVEVKLSQLLDGIKNQLKEVRKRIDGMVEEVIGEGGGIEAINRRVNKLISKSLGGTGVGVGGEAAELVGKARKTGSTVGKAEKIYDAAKQLGCTIAGFIGGTIAAVTTGDLTPEVQQLNITLEDGKINIGGRTVG